jgi:hypothetical protein
MISQVIRIYITLLDDPSRVKTLFQIVKKTQPLRCWPLFPL